MSIILLTFGVCRLLTVILLFDVVENLEIIVDDAIRIDVFVSGFIVVSKINFFTSYGSRRKAVSNRMSLSVFSLVSERDFYSYFNTNSFNKNNTFLVIITMAFVK